MEIAIIGAFQAVVVAVIVGLFNRSEKRRKKDCEKAEQRAKIRAKEGLLAMQMMSANVDLALATAIAVENQKVNGEMAEARRKAKEAQSNYYDFINTIATKQISEEL